MRSDEPRLNSVVTLLIVEVVAFVALLILFVALVKSASSQYGSAVGWVVLLSFVIAAIALAVLFTAVVITVRRKAQTSFRLLAQRFPNAHVFPAYWSAALLQPAFTKGPWLHGAGARGFGVIIVAAVDGISFWRQNATEAIASIAAGSIRDIQAITVNAPIGGRSIPALQIELSAPTDRLMQLIQVLPTNETGTETRDPERVKQVAASILAAVKR